MQGPVGCQSASAHHNLDCYYAPRMQSYSALHPPCVRGARGDHGLACLVRSVAAGSQEKNQERRIVGMMVGLGRGPSRTLVVAGLGRQHEIEGPKPVWVGCNRRSCGLNL
jgi:hypothetical protein